MRVRVVLAVLVMGATRVPAQQAAPPAPTVPIGVKWDLRLQTPVDSATARIDQRFEAVTLLDYSVDGRVLIPAVTPVRGFVGSVIAASNGKRGGSLTLSFDQIKIGERAMPLRASVEQLFKGQPSSETTARDGSDPSIGAAISRLPGGGQGGMVGLLVNPGGSITSTEGADVKLPLGTIIRIRIDRAIEIAGAGAM